MKYDYLVVGCGLAGLAICARLEERGRRFRVITDRSQQASRVAGGLYNPVILKRFSLAWKADRQIDVALPFYRALEDKLGLKLDHAFSIHRIFASPSEHNRWFEALDDPAKARFMRSGIEQLGHPQVHNPHGVGRLEGTGRVDTALLVSAYQQYLGEQGLLTEETLDYSALRLSTGGVEYGGNLYGHVIFCEGYGLKSNPYFADLPLVGTKGELLIVRAPGFHWETILKSSMFAVPLGGERYLLGATYKWKDKGPEPTPESREEIEDRVRRFLRVPWVVEDQPSGIRPTVTDRRPLVGTHPRFPRLHVFNGLGSRGVLVAPYLAGPLLDSIENGQPLDPEVDIRRFGSKFA